MCVSCRGRFSQTEMLRLQYQNDEIQKFSGFGRSFYVCEKCINDKKLDKIMQRVCKVNKDKSKQIVIKIKEM